MRTGELTTPSLGTMSDPLRPYAGGTGVDMTGND
jgi:hypothetical protein